MSDVHNHELARERPLARPRGLRQWRDELALRLTAAALAGIGRGRLRLTLPSGRSAVHGSGGAVEASLELRNGALLRKALLRGSIGFADCYVAGDIESENLADLFRFFLDNKPSLDKAGGGHFRVRTTDRLWHRLRANTRAGSRRNIMAHYDLGNAFYALWLDRDLQYSSAVFTAPDQTLEAAQAEKLDRILCALELAQGLRLLEIGCGWGGLAARAARAGVRVEGITLSPAQAEHCRARLAAAGLSDKVDIRLEDYRDTQGSFDRIVSVEMIEAVGEENWPRYFRTLHDRLAPGGVAVVQAITIDAACFERYRRKADFIQRYVFPGGMLPTAEAMAHHARAAGLTFETVERFGQSYAMTLGHWRRRFEASWPEIHRLGFDERFRRLWTYYLTYCEVGFERGVIDVGHYRMRKP